MTTFLILSDSKLSPQRIEADSVRYDDDAHMWTFRDGANKPVAWVPRDCADVVAEAGVINKP